MSTITTKHHCLKCSRLAVGGLTRNLWPHLPFQAFSDLATSLTSETIEALLSPSPPPFHSRSPPPFQNLKPSPSGLEVLQTPPLLFFARRPCVYFCAATMATKTKKYAGSHYPCSVIDCKNPSVNVHRIPVQADVKAKWIDFIFDGNVPVAVKPKLHVCQLFFYVLCLNVYIKQCSHASHKVTVLINYICIYYFRMGENS